MKGFVLFWLFCILSISSNAQIDYKKLAKVCNGDSLNEACPFSLDSAFYKIALLESVEYENIKNFNNDWFKSSWNDNLQLSNIPQQINEVVYVGCISKGWHKRKTCEYENNHQLNLEREEMKVNIYYASSGLLFASKRIIENVDEYCPSTYTFPQGSSYEIKRGDPINNITINDTKNWAADTIGQGIIKTNAISDISSNSAICKSSLIRRTSTPFKKMGICWSTLPNPKITDSTIETLPYFGEFTLNITKLSNNIHYYVRAYIITNSGNVYYGNELSFISIENTGTFTDTRDNHLYKYVKIGDQVIMTENFAYKPASGLFWPVNNEESKVISNGYLYDWKTAQKIAPLGWHLPSEKELRKLYKFLGDNSYKVFNSIQAGNSGFNPKLCGYRNPNGAFFDFDVSTNFWSSTPSENDQSWYFYYDSAYNIAAFGKLDKRYGCSVRLIKD